jgi:uncharacterized protein
VKSVKVKKIPLRRCVGCSESKPKKELVRIVKNKEGDISVDLTGKANGRGAYICKDAKCLEKARKNKRVERALETGIPDEVYERLLEEIESE